MLYHIGSNCRSVVNIKDNLRFIKTDYSIFESATPPFEALAEPIPDCRSIV